ncbi:unnamed protein product, partial [Amoebophrya sp. A120]|eukprot:GSA120T00016922001.1
MLARKRTGLMMHLRPVLTCFLLVAIGCSTFYSPPVRSAGAARNYQQAQINPDDSFSSAAVGPDVDRRGAMIPLNPGITENDLLQNPDAVEEHVVFPAPQTQQPPQTTVIRNISQFRARQFFGGGAAGSGGQQQQQVVQREAS